MTSTELIGALKVLRAVVGDVKVYAADDRDDLYSPEVEAVKASHFPSGSILLHPHTPTSEHTVVVIR